MSLSSEDDGEIILFPITDCGSYDSESGSHCSETESARDASDESSDEEVEADRNKRYISLRQRRLSKALAQFDSLQVNISNAQKNWIRAIKKARSISDPWQEFCLDNYRTETVFRHRYNALKKAWVTDEVKVKMQTKAFDKGAMRNCYRLKKLSQYSGHVEDNWNHTHNFVAKRYKEDVEREVYFQDVKMQMDAKLWGDEYSRHNPPKKVDMFQMYILEFKDRDGSPLYHSEHFIEGHYIKYNSNSGFVDESLRCTPQSFSHFTFERSGHQLIVVDIQGVGDLYTDPQIHTISEKSEYGDGNLGPKGMALFFHSHVCNEICRSMGLTEFDVTDYELKLHINQVKLQKAVAHTMARGSEELCMSPSPGEKVDVTSFLQLHRQRSASSNASDSGLDTLMSPIDEEPMSIGSPIMMSPGLYRGRVRYISDSENSITSQEEDIRNFQMKMQQMHRPSCVALEKDFRKLNFNTHFNDSALGKIHHEMAKYHELGRFCGKDDAGIDWKSALFHEQHAAELGCLEAILTMAKLFLGQERDVLINCVVEDDPENPDTGFDFMVLAADAGDRLAMIYVAKAFETGDGLGPRREMSWEDAIHWYDEALHTDNDEGGEYDSTMDDPMYELLSRQADMYAKGGHGLERMPEKAAEVYNEAAEAAMGAMKGRLANKWFALAEEMWGECE